MCVIKGQNMQSFLSNLKNSYNQTLVNMITIITISFSPNKEAFFNLQNKNVKGVSLFRILSQILVMKSMVIAIHIQQNQACAINLGWRSRFWFVKWIWKLWRSNDKNHSYTIPRMIKVGFRIVYMGGICITYTKFGWWRENHFLKDVLMLIVVDN